MELLDVVTTLELEPYLQAQVDAGLSGTDILHGHLKNLLHDAQTSYERALEEEEKTGEAMASMDRRYWEGVVDSLGDIYGMTYALAFAIQDRARERG